MTFVEYCPYCQGQSGTAGFIHQLNCPYNPISNVPAYQSPPPSFEEMVIGKLNEILRLLGER